MSDNEKKDILFNLKWIGYCYACMPPKDLDPDVRVDYSDFVNFCKFSLCEKRGIMLKDPIWEKYQDEDIIAEFFGNLYYNDKDAKEAFEAAIRGEDPDLTDWFNEQIRKNKEDLEKRFEEDVISLSPDDIKGK